MNVYKAIAIGLAGCLLSAGPGCTREKPLTIHFTFEDAKSLSSGDKVLGDGIVIGLISEMPVSTKPGQVLVTAKLDKISPEKLPYLTAETRAVIKKDSVVAGSTYLAIMFPETPGQTVPDGTTLIGDTSYSIMGVDFPNITNETVRRWCHQVFDVRGRAVTGPVPFYLNWICLIVVAATFAALILDFFVRMMQGKVRRQPSNGFLRTIWVLFVICAVLKFGLVVLHVTVLMHVLDYAMVAPWVTGFMSYTMLIASEASFWALVLVLASFRTKFDLLSKGVKA